MSTFEVGDTVQVKDNAEEYNSKNPAGWAYAMGNKDVITIVDTEVSEGVKLYCDNKQYSWIEEQLEPMENTDNFVPFYVEVDGPQHSKLLQEIAFEEGYEWRSGASETKNTKYSYLSLGFNYSTTDNRKVIGFSQKGPQLDEKELENPTLQEFRDALNGMYFEPEPEPIEILGYEVEFFDDTVVVGCREFSASDIDTLYTMAVDAKDQQETTIDGVDFQVDSTLTINGEEVDPDLIIKAIDRFYE